MPGHNEFSRASNGVETLEFRRLLSTYLIDSSEALLAVNAANLEPGDQVLFRGATEVAGTLQLGAEDAGTKDSPVLISSYDPLTLSPLAPDVGADQRATLYSGTGGGIVATNVAGIRIVALNVLGSGRTTNTSSGIGFSNGLPNDVKLSLIEIDHVGVSGYRDRGIVIYGTRGKSGFSNVTIRNSAAYNNGLTGIETYGVFNARSSTYAHTDVVVENCLTYGNTGIPGHSSNSGSGIVLGDVNIGLVQRSEAFDNGALNTHVGGPVGIWTWDSNAITIRRNHSHHNRSNSTADGGGFDLDGGVTNSIMEYNYSHDNDGAGYGIFQFRGARPFGNNVVRYNISENDARKNNAAIDVWDGGSGVSKVEVYNNTIVLSQPATTLPAVIRVQTATTSLHFRNNIFQARSNGINLVQVANVRGQRDLRFESNDYHIPGSSALTIKWDKTTYTSLSAFRSGTGQETIAGVAVGMSVDPLFVDPAGGSAAAFAVQIASPLRSAGLDLRARFAIDPGTQDFFGNSLPQGSGYEIGAAEIVDSAF